MTAFERLQASYTSAPTTTDINVLTPNTVWTGDCAASSNPDDIFSPAHVTIFNDFGGAGLVGLTIVDEALTTQDTFRAVADMVVANRASFQAFYGNTEYGALVSQHQIFSFQSWSFPSEALYVRMSYDYTGARALNLLQRESDGTSIACRMTTVDNF